MEMLITLVIFSFTMLVIYSLIGANLRLLNRLSASETNKTRMALFAKVLDNIARNSYNISWKENGVFLDGFDQNQYQLTASNQVFTLKELKGGMLWNEKKFAFREIDKVEWAIQENGAKKALSLKIEAKNFKMNRLFLLGFKKKED
jgi:hypothetical protein